MALTEAWLAKHYRQKQERVVEKADGDGLSVRVTTGGRIVFQMRYQYQGKAKRLDLGIYPGMNLLAARNECARMQLLRMQGVDPAEHKAQNAEEPAQETVRDVLTQWHARYATIHVKNHHVVLAAFENHIFPVLGDQAYINVKPKAWFDLLERIGLVLPQMASNLLVYLKLAQNWALVRGISGVAPLASVKAKHLGIVKVHRKRVLDHDEIAIVLDTLSMMRMKRPFKILVELCLMFGCRSGELSSARKEHFNFVDGLWTIPPESHKEGKFTQRPIIRPIVKRAQSLLEELFTYSQGSEWVMTKNGRDEPQGRSGLSNLTGLILKQVEKNYGEQLEPFTLHDLRRTARTNWSILTEPHVAETMLGHALPGMMKVYDQNHYLLAQKQCYEDWWDMVEQIRESAGGVIVVDGEL